MWLCKINLNEIRRAGAHDDGVFNECKFSDQEFDDEIASICYLLLIRKTMVMRMMMMIIRY